jgi:hypothetical protein
MPAEKRVEMRVVRGLACGVMAIAAWAIALPAHAIDLERLVMPGPVISGHADVESDCDSCHRSFDANAQTALCLECHEEVALDVEEKKGLHGKGSASSGQLCRSCHPEHRGRDADITGLTRETFDHANTDFALEGSHRRVACDSCHPAGDAYRKAESDCVACHAKDDRHGTRLGDACADCHVPASWGEAAFDHSTTKFALTGAHAKADCGLCHPGDRYGETPMDCSACHTAQDVHRGQLGSACGDCHTSTRWKEGSFDHDRDTKFPLVGEHRSARCNDCHLARGASAKKPALDKRCLSCHAAQDDHDGSFGTRCETCHSPRSWTRSLFRHKRDADFALTGAHASLDCTSCHHGVLGSETLAQSCVGCHAESDLHAGQLGRECETCHASTAWTRDLTFDHDITAFPLLGMHAVAGCEDCHSGRRFHDASQSCADCHRGDDIHKRKLGDDCARCHNPNSWTLWRFDHNRSTHFALRGGHSGLDCLACHSAPAGGTVRLSSRCESCHSLDDPHRGGFGARCETCHVERSWKDVRTPH